MIAERATLVRRRILLRCPPAGRKGITTCVAGRSFRSVASSSASRQLNANSACDSGHWKDPNLAVQLTYQPDLNVRGRGIQLV